MTTSAPNDPAVRPPLVMVSVVIVSWNASDYLVRCLRSLSHEVCRFPMEIIVVDNGSTDDSAVLVAELFPHVHLIRSPENLGFARASNLGAVVGRGRYLCFVNSDVEVLPDCITRLVTYCEGEPGVGMVGPRIRGGDGKLQRTCRGFPTIWNMTCRMLALDTLFPRAKAFTGYSLLHWPQDELRSVEVLSGCFWLVRQDALTTVGMLDESFFMYGEDLDWCLRFRKAGWTVVFLPEAEAVHHGGASSANAPVRFYVEKQRADLRYWAKHHSPAARAAYFLISCSHMVTRAVGYAVVGICRRHGAGEHHQKVHRSLACLKWLLTGRMPTTAAPAGVMSLRSGQTT